MARDPAGKITGSATQGRRARRPPSAAAGEQYTHGAAVTEVQFQAVLEAIGDGFISLDSNYHCTYVNEAAATLLNTTAGELTGRPIWEAIAPARYAQLHEEITRAAEQKLHVKFEEYCVWCEHWFRWHCYPTADGLAIFTEDISERKEAEEQVARSEEHYRLLFETMPVGVVYQDAEGKIISMNPAAERILGRTPAEFLGRTSAEEEYHTLREDGSPFPGREHPSMIALRTGQEVRDVVMGVYNPRVQAYRWINITAVPLVRPGEDKPYQVYTHFSDITELRQAERALRYSERRFRKLFESDPIGIFITKPDGTFLDCNEAMAKMLGYDSREELLRHRSTELYVDPEFREEAVRLLQTEGVYLGQEGRVWRKDGSIAHLLGAAVLLKDEETGEPYIQGVAVDITERRHTEEALRKSEERYRKLFEANLAGVYITKLDGTIVDFNTAMMKMLGYDSREELLQKRPTDLYADPAFRQVLVRLIQEKGVVVGKEALLQRKDGSVLYAHGAAALLRDDETGELYIQGVVVDISERKRTEEALRASEERYRKLFEANMAGVYLAKLDGTIVDFNEAMMKMLGYDSREEVFRHHVPDFYVDPEVRLELIRLLQRDGIVQSKEVLLRKKDGSVLYALGSAALIPDERTGEPTILGVALDVTDRRKAEEELHFTEARFRALFAQTPLSIQILSPEGRTVEINRAWEELWAVTGLPYDLKDWNILHDRQIEAMGILPHIQKGFAGEATETPVVLYDPAEAGYPGRPRWLKAYIYPIKDHAGRILQVVVTHVDVTELVETEKALARSVKDLEFLSVSALHYLEALPSAELFQYTAQQLQAVAGHAVIAVSEYDPGTNQTIVREVAGPEDKLRKLPRLLGRDAVGLVFTVAEGTLERATPGRLELVKGGLHELTFSQMPLPLTTLIEQELGVGEIYAMPFVLGGDFMGTVAIATDRAEGLQNRELLEAIVNHAALALKRTRTEEALRERERALREIEQRLRGVLENSLDLVYRRDPQQDHYDYLSPMVEQITGFTAAEIADWSIEDVLARVHPDDAERTRQELLEAMAAGRGKIEYRFRRKDGRFCWIADHFTVQKDEQGKPLYFAGVARDVTARREAEEALRENEERLRLALEGGQMGRWEWDLQTNSMSWSERSSELLGLDPPAKIPVEAFLERVHPDDRETVKTRMTQALQKEIDLEMEFRVLPRPGELQEDVSWLASRGKVIRDARGQAIRMIGVMFDVTRRKRMEERLRQLNDQLAEEVQSQTEQLRTTASRVQDEAVRRVSVESELRKQSQMLEGFFQHTITPLAFLDRHFNFIRVNSAFAQAFGRDPDYFIGKNYFALYAEKEDRAIFERVVRTKQPYFAQAKPATDPKNPARALTYWDWQLTPLLDRTGQVQSLVLNSEDVTQQQQAVFELEHRARQLQKLMLDLTQAEDRERRRLADILHDDLQQLLAAAKFHLSLLDHGAGSHRNAQEIARQAKEIIKDAIEKSRSLSHELSPAILYQGSLDETFDWLARQMHNKYGLTVHVETAGPVELQSEPLRAFLFRATQELLFNVVKHARVNEATVRVRRCRQYLCLSVSDRGRGLDPTQLKEIAGFGLLGIRERAELLGGRMKIKSVTGKGSRFLIIVPDAEKTEDRGQKTEDGKQAGEGSLSSALRHPSSSDTLRVLLADDHEIVRQGIAALLREEATIQVVGEAADGREAVNLAYQLRPDVVVMDVSMPRMNGEEATRQIKRHLPEIRIVALSMYEEPETIERMCQAGAEGYVLKTAPPEELLAAIRGRVSVPEGEQRRPAGRVDP